jgi:acyl carrier protein
MRNDLIDGLRRLIVEDLYVEIPPEQIGLDDGLRTVVGLDSIGFAELRVRCEARFGVQIDDEDYTPENFGSIRRLADVIDRLQNARRTPAAPAAE